MTQTMICPHILEMAIQYNNRAVQELELYDYEKAYVLLKKAIMMIAKKQPNHKTKISRCPNDSDSVVQFQWSPNDSTRTSSVANAHNDGGRFIFYRGIYILPSLYTTVAYGCHIKAAMLYNCALAHHLLAPLLDHTTPDAMLQQSQRLYFASQNLMQKYQAQQRKQQRSNTIRINKCFLRLFHVAVWNNMGQISLDLVNYTAFQCCLERLDRYLHRHAAKKTVFIADGNDLAEMHRNVLMNVPTAAPVA